MSAQPAAMRASVVQRGRTANEMTPRRPTAASEADVSAPVKDAAATPRSQAIARNAGIISLDCNQWLDVSEHGLRQDLAHKEFFHGGKRSLCGS